MRVTRLEIFGFKSFVERFSLSFDESIIGIVGPNGCGKSNIVDALRWVLGETQAKHLRGKSLEDLIFNGSESRRPLGMAEVSLTIRPNEGWSDDLEPAEVVEPASSSAVDFSPESTASESLPPAQDVTSVEEGVEASREIDLEQMGAEVEVAPDGGLENGASANTEPVTGIIPAALMQIPGLFEASEIQLTRRLYRSGESEYFVNRVPCRLRDLVEIYRLIGLGARGLSIVQQGQIGELISKKPIERRELLEEAAGISGFRARMEAATRKLKKTSENMSRLADIILEVEKQVRSLKRQANRARARDEVKSLLKEAEIELFRCRSALIHQQRLEIASQAVEIQEDLQTRKSKMSLADAERTEHQAKLETIDTELMTLRGQREELYQTLNRERRRLEECQVQLARVEGKERAVEESREQITARREQISREQEERQTELQEQNSRLSEVESAQRTVEEKLRALEESNKKDLEAFVPEESTPASSERSEQMRLLESRLEELPELQSLIKDSERRLSSARSEVARSKDALFEAQKELSNTERERSTIVAQLERMAQHVKDKSESTNVEALASALKVPQHLERAVSAALGDRAEYVVSSEPEKLAAEYLGASSEGAKKRRIGVIAKRDSGAQVVGGQGHRPLAEHELSVVPEATLLLDLLEIESSVRPSLELMLGDLAITPNLEQALALNASNSEKGLPERLIVTPQGEVVTPWGWYTTQGESVGLSFRRRIEELDEILRDLQTIAADRLQQVETSEKALAEAKSELHVGLRSRDALLEVQQRLSRLLQEEKAEEKKARDRAIQQERQRQEAARAKERAVELEVRAAMKETSDAKNAVRYVERALEGLEAELGKLSENEQRLAEQREALAAEKQQLSEALAIQSSDEAKRSAEEVQNRYEEVLEEITKVEERRDAVNLKVAEAAQAVSEAREGLDSLSEKESAFKLQSEKLSLEMQMLHEEVVKQYGEEVQTLSETEAQQLFEATEVDGSAEGSETSKSLVNKKVASLREDASKLRRRLEREGEVDPEAITRYEEEQARLDEMQAQHADLTLATTTLERTIRQLKDVSRTRFLDTFNDVSKRFTELVPRLFGGGAGHLELLDPEDPLTSGVEITVRPPGKRITTMELMSGGEKALVATAVLMAMFLHKPSPICVLDEVDAPLDDANLERFLDLITEHSDKTQYLIITHNKSTMRAVDRLLGITMEESGVSKPLSVNFAEAEEEIERWAANA